LSTLHNLEYVDIGYNKIEDISSLRDLVNLFSLDIRCNPVMECFIVKGQANASGDFIDHAWNIVNIGGKYRHIDVTWDDPEFDLEGSIWHDYFSLTDDQVSRDHRWNQALYPKCGDQ